MPKNTLNIMWGDNPCRDEWAYDGNSSDTLGLFLPNGFCLLGITFTGWKRELKGYWHAGIVILNTGFGIWYGDNSDEY